MTGTNCPFHPKTVFLLVTLTATSAATAMLCAAMITEHWEYISWDKEKLASIEKNLTRGSSAWNNHRLDWLLDGEVARIVLESKFFQETGAKTDSENEPEETKDPPALFLTPVRAGIWTSCVHLSAEQHRVLQYMGFPNALCNSFLKLRTLMEGSKRMDWQHRMRNLSISCALVCLIILASSALTGAFGVTKRQISAILVTGVMYLLAGIFATFSFTIINLKTTRSKLNCLNASSSYSYARDGLIVSSTALEKAYSLNNATKYLGARIFSTGYSLQLGWGGIGTCIMVSIFWILLSKFMRYNPIAVLIIVF